MQDVLLRTLVALAYRRHGDPILALVGPAGLLSPVLAVAHDVAPVAEPGLARRAAVLVAPALGHQTGEDLDDQRPDHGQTGADERYVHLDDCPHGRGDVVGAIGRCGGDVDGSHSEAGGDDDEASEGEDEDESHLLDSLDLKLVDQRHGDEENEKVGSNAESGVGPPELLVVDAGTRNALVIGAWDGSALEDGRCDGGCGVQSHGRCEEIAGPFEPPDIAEDSDVEQKN